MVVILLAWLSLQDGLFEVETTQINDYLEGQHHFFLLDAFSDLVAVAKNDQSVTRIPLKGSGPKEIKVPLSLTQTPAGPMVSGLFYQLLVRETPTGIAFADKSQLPALGPLVYDNGHDRLFGTAANYWDDEGKGFSATLAQNSTTTLLLPFENPIGARHPRAFAAISRSEHFMLYGQPVTMAVQLFDLSAPTKPINLPVDWTCIQPWSGQKPKQFKDGLAFVNSWDRFLANGSWLAESQSHIYAVVTFETKECADAVSFLWIIQRDGLKVVERKRFAWQDERPLGFFLGNGVTWWIVAKEGIETTTIYLK